MSTACFLSPNRCTCGTCNTAGALRVKCRDHRLLDAHYRTSTRSPLHHDNVCKCGKKSAEYPPVGETYHAGSKA